MCVAALQNMLSTYVDIPGMRGEYERDRFMRREQGMPDIHQHK